MVTHMKTTIEIADPLFLSAKAIAAREKTTVRALVEQGLRHVVESMKQPEKFRLRRASFRGNGLQPQVQDGSWETIRELLYEGRGG